jgi:hypothetical protein
MARLITYSEAVIRFSGLVVNGLTIESAIQEAVDRIFEMGRFPGTTTELTIADEDWVTDVESGITTISFDEQEYAGALGFRNDHRGWAIVDRTALYKDGANAGDFEFVDYGTVETEDGKVRTYRAPINWNPEAGPFYVLLKKEAPILEDADLVPVEGMGPLKCAIQAVCLEFTGDQSAAQAKWAEMNGLMIGAQRQAEGPKRYTSGMDSSLRRHPKQFM